VKKTEAPHFVSADALLGFLETKAKAGPALFDELLAQQQRRRRRVSERRDSQRGKAATGPSGLGGGASPAHFPAPPPPQRVRDARGADDGSGDCTQGRGQGRGAEDAGEAMTREAERALQDLLFEAAEDDDEPASVSPESGGPAWGLEGLDLARRR
jgi:hypothetical protein